MYVATLAFLSWQEISRGHSIHTYAPMYQNWAGIDPNNWLENSRHDAEDISKYIFSDGTCCSFVQIKLSLLNGISCDV